MRKCPTRNKGEYNSVHGTPKMGIVTDVTTALFGKIIGESEEYESKEIAWYIYREKEKPDRHPRDDHDRGEDHSGYST